MKTNIIISALVVIFAIGNIGTGYGKIFKNVVENKENNTTTISLYEGKDDIIKTPLKQYEIRYSDNNQPVEKIVYKWNAKKRTWAFSEKYEYLYEDDGRPQALMHSEWNNKTKSWNQKVEYALYLFDIDKELLTLNN